MTDKTSQTDRQTASLDEHREADGQTDRSNTVLPFITDWFFLM